MTVRPFIAVLTAAWLATAAQAQPPRPKLIVAISVDQFSADLFAEYRQHFTGGLRRLSEGVVFPSGYQSHAATETCPGHSTILTGSRPYRTGIIANEWIDFTAPRADKKVYCAEDESTPGTDSRNYVASSLHLKVPTLGERMLAAIPGARSVSIAGKDRAAIMMGGHRADQMWWFDGKAYVGPKDQSPSPVVAPFNALLATRLATAQPQIDYAPLCAARARPVALGEGKQVGAGRFGRAAGEVAGFRASPEYDSATLALAWAVLDEMKLGRGAATDILDIGLSATDYVGHTYGPGGAEMCQQLLTLDRMMGEFFDRLDATGVPYVVVLTADHGGHDIPERNREHAVLDSARASKTLLPEAVGATIAAELRLRDKDKVLAGLGTFGDLYVDPAVPRRLRGRVLARAKAIYEAAPQVAAVFTKAELLAQPVPLGPPENWTLLQRTRASFDAHRSGDLVILLKPRVEPVPDVGRGYVMTHGTPWDYDRRVPILFWWKGAAGFEQPLAVETIDIMPTLASLIGLDVPPAEIDGRCLDLDASAASNCPVATPAANR